MAKKPAKTSKPAAAPKAKPKAAAVKAKPAASQPRAAAAASADGAQGQYVYCIIQSESPLTFGPLGIGHDPAEVHTVHFKNLAAVVSATPMVVHDPTRENVLAHQRVNETVMLQHTVLPMSFGTVFKTTNDIVELLRSAYDAFT
ncbi:MAG: GvpL/GvpF family gas vesicle protein, partial [Acidobacteriota bacterium]|nr:GvpL/GvpF family gas vesicle protein [Acidobacteriota bacterium]